MIADTITQKIGEALKARDEIRLSTLRMLSSALNYEKIAKQHDLTEDEELVVVKKEAKMRKDAIEAMHLAQGKPTFEGRSIEDRLLQEEQELAILQEYLPKDVSDEDLVKFVNEAIAETGATDISAMGKVIGAVMQKAGGRADGAKVAQMVKVKLSL